MSDPFLILHHIRVCDLAEIGPLHAPIHDVGTLLYFVPQSVFDVAVLTSLPALIHDARTLLILPHCQEIMGWNPLLICY